MKTRIVQIAFTLICTVVAAALQDMAPSFGGTKPPLLTLLALYWAISQPSEDGHGRPGEGGGLAVRWLLAAIFVGSFDDALGELPTPCATIFTVLACSAARLGRGAFLELPRPLQGLAIAMLAAPLRELWLTVWGEVDGMPMLRFFACAIPAAPAGAVIFALAAFLERHVGFRMPSENGGLA